MSSKTSATSFGADRDFHRVVWLTLALFLAYLCVAMSLPVTSLYVTIQLGFGNALAGLAVGVAFASTILTRGLAGRLADRRGGKTCLMWGFWFTRSPGSWASLRAGVAYRLRLRMASLSSAGCFLAWARAWRPWGHGSDPGHYGTSADGSGFCPAWHGDVRRVRDRRPYRT